MTEFVDFTTDFDPEAPWPEEHPHILTPDQRRQAAALQHYQLVRLAIELEERASYMGALAGLSDDEMLAIAERAEADAKADEAAAELSGETLDAAEPV